jgi:hypothetical protein
MSLIHPEVPNNFANVEHMNGIPIFSSIAVYSAFILGEFMTRFRSLVAEKAAKTIHAVLASTVAQGALALSAFAEQASGEEGGGASPIIGSVDASARPHKRFPINRNSVI